MIQMRFSHQVKLENSTLRFYVEQDGGDNPITVIKRFVRGQLKSFEVWDEEGEQVSTWRMSKRSIQKFNNGSGQTALPKNIWKHENMTLIAD